MIWSHKTDPIVNNFLFRHTESPKMLLLHRLTLLDIVLYAARASGWIKLSNVDLFRYNFHQSNDLFNFQLSRGWHPLGTCG